MAEVFLFAPTDMVTLQCSQFLSKYISFPKIIIPPVLHKHFFITCAIGHVSN